MQVLYIFSHILLTLSYTGEHNGNSSEQHFTKDIKKGHFLILFYTNFFTKIPDLTKICIN
jgi:hypothetical protein